MYLSHCGTSLRFLYWYESGCCIHNHSWPAIVTCYCGISDLPNVASVTKQTICCKVSSFSITHSTLWIMNCYCHFTGNFWTVHPIVRVTEATFGRPFIPWKWRGENACSLTYPNAGAPDCNHNRTVKLMSRWDNCLNVLIQWNKLATYNFMFTFHFIFKT